jgi:hypothetical protein
MRAAEAACRATATSTQAAFAARRRNRRHIRFPRRCDQGRGATASVSCARSMDCKPSRSARLRTVDAEPPRLRGYTGTRPDALRACGTKAWLGQLVGCRYAGLNRGCSTLAAFLYDTRHAAKVANAFSGVRSGFSANSKIETPSKLT